MIRIGILGSDSSHALAFAKLCNLPDQATGEYHYPDIRITSIYGQEELQTKKVALEGQINTIVTTPDEMLGTVDAAMILFRDGSLHASYALPLIKANIPVWIDKPLTIRLEDARLLLMEADQHHSLITGGSTCKYNQDVVNIKEILSTGRFGSIVSGYMNFPGDINSPYHGLHFYGPHMAEMLFTIFGYDVRSVTASLHHSEIICVANYEESSVVLNFNNSIPDSYCIIHGENSSHVSKIQVDEATYKSGFEKFVEMLKTGQRPISLDKLVAPTILITAILEALKTGREVFLNQYTI